MKKVLSVLITAALMLQLLVMFGAVSAEGAAAMTVTSTSGTVGSTVTVEVGIANNPGFHALECQIEYDKTLLKLESITAGEKLAPTQTSVDPENQFITSLGDAGKPAGFVYLGISFNENPPAIVKNELVTGDVTLATLTFTMLAAGTANVNVTCIESLSLDDTLEMNQFVTLPATGTVTIAEKPAYVRGDVNGDGVVDDNDAIRLLLFTLFGAEDYPINQNGDMNGDGVEDDSDVIHLLLFTLFGAEDYPLSQ
ncbi:MAG: hypothetical protein IJB43_00515 [Clostridia bacterium]|nr:hypothetical protein [Clostridia bacterium]